jgi:hypothetical protein
VGKRRNATTAHTTEKELGVGGPIAGAVSWEQKLGADSRSWELAG